MTEAVPDDVMKRARLLIYETIGAVDFPNGKFLIEGYYDDSLIDAIARALMEERAAERERAAKIADAQAENARLGPALLWQRLISPPPPQPQNLRWKEGLACHTAGAGDCRGGDLEDHAFAAEVASERIAAAIRGQS